MRGSRRCILFEGYVAVFVRLRIVHLRFRLCLPWILQ